MSDYEPPKTAWDFRKFIEAPLEEILTKRVGCSNCPVSMLCMAGEGGTGYVCQECGSTGVWVEEPSPGAAAEDVLLLDCAEHKFDRSDKNKTTRRCSICSGEIMELFVRHVKSNMHFVATEHARVPVETRQTILRDALAYWLKKDADTKKEALDATAATSADATENVA